MGHQYFSRAVFCVVVVQVQKFLEASWLDLPGKLKVPGWVVGKPVGGQLLDRVRAANHEPAAFDDGLNVREFPARVGVNEQELAEAVHERKGCTVIAGPGDQGLVGGNAKSVVNAPGRELITSGDNTFDVFVVEEATIGWRGDENKVIHCSPGMTIDKYT